MKVENWFTRNNHNSPTNILDKCVIISRCCIQNNRNVHSRKRKAIFYEDNRHSNHAYSLIGFATVNKLYMYTCISNLTTNEQF